MYILNSKFKSCFGLNFRFSIYLFNIGVVFFLECLCRSADALFNGFVHRQHGHRETGVLHVVDFQLGNVHLQKFFSVFLSSPFASRLTFSSSRSFSAFSPASTFTIGRRSSAYLAIGPTTKYLRKLGSSST